MVTHAGAIMNSRAHKRKSPMENLVTNEDEYVRLHSWWHTDLCNSDKQTLHIR